MRLVGQWDKLRKVFRNLTSGNIIKEEELQNFGKAIEQRVIQHINSQDLGWSPLSQVTIRKKGHEKIFLDKRDFVKSIKVSVSKKGLLVRTIMVRPEGIHTNSGLSMATLAKFLEYGTKNMVARPLWRPTIKEVSQSPEFSAFAEKIIDFYK